MTVRVLLLALLASAPAFAAKPIPVGHVPVVVGEHGHAEGRMTMLMDDTAAGAHLAGDVREAFDWEVLEVTGDAVARLRVTWTEQAVGFGPGTTVTPTPGPLAGRTVVLAPDEHDEPHVVEGEATDAELASLPFTFADLVFQFASGAPPARLLPVGPVDPGLLPTLGPTHPLASATVLGLRRHHGRRLVAVDITTADPEHGTSTVHGTMWIDPRSGRVAEADLAGRVAIPAAEGAPPLPTDLAIAFRTGAP